jgi:hypothetical protein
MSEASADNGNLPAGAEIVVSDERSRADACAPADAPPMFRGMLNVAATAFFLTDKGRAR